VKEFHDIEGLSENLKAIISCIDEGIHVVNTEGVTVYYNEKAAELDGLSVDEVLGRNILEVFPSLSEETSTLIKVLRTGEPILGKVQTFTNYKGSKITTLNSTIPLKQNGNIIGALEVSKDITRVKELSEKILDLQKELYTTKGARPQRGIETGRFTVDDIIGEHPKMRELKDIVLKAARTSSSVLVYGSTGTGKELVVQAIHSASARRHMPFIAQNCAALPANLLEGILFGTVKGSFTDAKDRPGLFHLTDGGTLFLDEVNSMPPELQAKLLRVIEEGLVRRIGDVYSEKVDVRVMAALNTNPWDAVKNGSLRQDLFYRLNVVTIRVPDLREHIEDIPLLVNHFIRKYNIELDMQIKGMSPRAVEILKKYMWPGNVRELENAVESAMNIMEGDIIYPRHLPIHIRSQAAAGRNKAGEKGILPLRRILEEREREVIMEALGMTGYNISQTAGLLKIPRQTLQYRIKKLRIPLPKNGQK
jgi:arginine utilization regulatory protein